MTFDREQLETALNLLIGSAGNPRSFPVLGCVRIAGDRLVTTDMDVTTVVAVPTGDLDVCVDARRLHDVVRLADSPTVRLSVDGSHGLTIETEGR